MTAMQRDIDRPRAAGDRAGATILIRVLMWPVLGLLITGGFHFTIEAIWPDLRTFFVPAALAPLLLGYGTWAGYRTIRAGGSYLTAIVAGVVLGLLPLALEAVGFGIVLDRGVQNGLLAGIFGFSMILFGALAGAGFVLSGHGADADR